VQPAGPEARLRALDGPEAPTRLGGPSK
jgi:hypothetical protein